MSISTPPPTRILPQVYGISQGKELPPSQRELLKTAHDRIDQLLQVDISLCPERNADLIIKRPYSRLPLTLAELNFLGFHEDLANRSAIVAALLQRSADERLKVARLLPPIYQQLRQFRDYFFTDAKDQTLLDHMAKLGELSGSQRAELITMLTEPVELSSRLSQTMRTFVDPEKTIDDPLTHQRWNYFGFNPQDKVPDPIEFPFKGYLQIDHTQLPDALSILFQNMSNLALKFITQSVDESRSNFVPLPDHFIYGVLNPSAPVLVFYGQNRETVRATLKHLSQLPEWQIIERTRLSNQSTKNSQPFSDREGKIWTTLCSNPDD